jgi:hypothetical protein
MAGYVYPWRKTYIAIQVGYLIELDILILAVDQMIDSQAN